ncbi:zinc-binding metallopeptidase [Pontibacter burrus]|uniref:Substrate import-associated zinc metallohydrolase lipoprotein n=1 Tax=Pontibacter burrus TaxID=2704466 RepID=A0A6B3LPS1_9BACT|nr:putative zinc-binding metallopeptidase [Pontibacter burrus]NEM97843.1 hypothetical protein [Pontibacter burrus]
MKLRHIKVAALLLAVTFVTACSKDDEDLNKPILGLGGDSWTHSELDKWLYQNFTVPYNIEVKYRWDGSELALDRTLVPAKEEKIQPLMETMKHAWIDVYEAEAGETFVKRFVPKQYVLVGSPQYNASGTITLGEAEGGRKVTLYRVNQFEKNKREIVQPILKTIQHEFAHILHQTVMYPPEYEQITPMGYTSSWNNISVTNARESGYISSYAQASPNEDFVEMIAIMLTQGKTDYEAIIAGISNPEAVAALRKKEEIVVTYFKQVWNIDFYKLQARAELALEDIAPKPVIPLHTQFGFGNIYSTMMINPAGQSDDFLEKYNTADANLKTAGGRYIEYIRLIAEDNNRVTYQIRYINPSSGSPFVANFIYNMSVDNKGVASFTIAEAPAGNANTYKTHLAPLTNYIELNTFKIEWKDGKPVLGATEQYGKFTATGNPSSFFFGQLGN